MNTLTARLVRPLAAAALILVGQAALAAAPVEGVNYKPLKPAVPTNVAPGKVEVVEVFWYACGHCYLLEPKIAAWERKGKAPYVEVVRMPAVWNEVLKTHARLFYTIEVLGKRELHDEVFREINVRGNRLETPEKIHGFRGGVEAVARRGSQPSLPHLQHADRDRERQVRHRREHGGRRGAALRGDRRARGAREAGRLIRRPPAATGPQASRGLC